MHKLNPVAELGVDGTVKEYLWADYKPAKATTSRDGKFYIISCGQDDGDVSVCQFESEEAFIKAIDKDIEWMIKKGYNTGDSWIYDAVNNAADGGHLVGVSLWG
jgi:hypothetical protein